ncbi:integral membrane protein DUF106-domain-containing protein [Cantharellus anzutake]|uniref:integral membrane protein DUF106-domain-containing protein n=1 Tax=Cantharellus anzutake TaxID=1750568 RepID=UPI0019039637|nr:integral membrane protein DUF106-domain-containing protein [Cantharellus anzutake]KAF8338907.1 integral membrane protein DUF106-domain-containing protein [Cantharellus anzutake]
MVRRGEEENPPNPFADPGAMDGMVEGLKKQMVMMMPQMLIMGWINFFFQGFVLIKLLFPLTLGFKSMMQRGIKTLDMDKMPQTQRQIWLLIRLRAVRS